MAYIYKDYRGVYSGPYPSKAGDFCGNSAKDDLEIADDGITILKRGIKSSMRTKEIVESKEVGRFRIGRPSNCPAGTSEEMAARGNVGVYIVQERSFRDKEIEVDTDDLQEEVVSGQRAALKPFNMEGWVAKTT